MKVYYSIIIALVIVVSTTTCNIPAKKFECPPDKQIVRLPHPYKCTLYYICENGRKTLQTCPGGLHFNPIIKQCDWPPGCVPWLIEPESEEAENEEEVETKLDDPSRCVGKCPIIDPIDRTVHLPYANDCGKFCVCSNGVLFVMNCPKGLHYDKKKMVCNWPWDAGCE